MVPKRNAHRAVSSGSIYYYAEDFIGSSRVITTAAGTVCYDADFYPFGGERLVTNTCPQNYKFTGKERDSETGNDDFGARYFSSSFGRWLSPDWSVIPAPVPYATLTNPQTLNLYQYVGNNPETFADLDGHLWSPWPIGNQDPSTGSFDNSNNLDYLSGATIGDSYSGSQPYQNLLNQEQGQPQKQPPQNQKPDQPRAENQPNQPQLPETPKPPSWDPKKPLPGDPKDLGPDWQHDLGHKAPNDERWVNPNGDKLDWHKGKPPGTGKGYWDEHDHWHWNERKWHFRPGDTVSKVATAIAVGVVVYWVVSEVSRLFPPRNLVPVL